MNTKAARHRILVTTTLLLGLACAGPAFAHPGHGLQNFATALAHPFSGLDHLLAMVLVGLWAAFSGQASRTRLPLGFLVGLALGALAGAMGWALPGVQAAIGLGLLLLGVLCAAARPLPVISAVLVVAVVGFTHGNAHGIELGASLPTLAGMLAGSAVLHGVGLLLGTTNTGWRGALLRTLAGVFALLGFCAT